MPYLSQRCVCADSWSSRNLAALPGQQTLSPRPTSEDGDARLESAWFWGECHESSRSRTSAGEDNDGSFGRERQGVPIFRGRHCRDWCSGPESWGDGEGFLPYWTAASRRKQWAGVRTMGAIYFKLRVFFRTWDTEIFRRVCVATLDSYSSDRHQEIAALGRIFDALGPDVSVVSISGGSTIFVDAFCEYLGSGYRQKLIDYPFLDLPLFKRCLQRTASNVFGSLDGLATTEFIVNRLKGAETRDWMSSRPDLKKAILTNDLNIPHLFYVVANIIGVWPLIVAYLKETGCKDDGDSLVVKSSTFDREVHHPTRIYCSVMFRRKELTGTSSWIRWCERSSVCCIFFLISVSSPIHFYWVSIST